ncbi:MAG: MBL fold metallo-hydrolase [Clostridium sp.]|nr:MBL fold metallo-hydrolase [Clostridium sp.]
MKITNLVENTKGSRDCLFEHGLSFYVETKKHKILADAGSSDAFLQNAERLGVDLGQADMMVLSHGHYDHAGGILAFAKKNPKARIFMQRLAGEPYFHEKDGRLKYIGMDARITELPQAELIDGDKKIDDEVFLFSGVSGRRLWPLGNRELKVKSGDVYRQDEFLHEQYLVLEEGKKRVLMSGCAHNGILNILDRYQELFGSEPDAVISGFHMQKKSGYTEEDLELIRATGRELKKKNTIFYTGHCTGELPFQVLKECMGERLVYVHSGDEIRL